VADGLGGSSERARALEIMKDSRVGAFGAMALVLALLSKVALLALLGSVDGGLMAVALFAAHVCSRTWPLLLIRCMPHVGDAAGSKSKPLADQISNASLLVALAWFAAAAALVLWLTEGVAWWAPVLASLLALLWLGRLLWRRLQGFTGDGLGATQQVCELAFYLGLAVTV
jgi:adenosylcobinamide-GDP ribazoletransferase